MIGFSKEYTASHPLQLMGQDVAHQKKKKKKTACVSNCWEGEDE
jgi:hypothetical protein